VINFLKRFIITKVDLWLPISNIIALTIYGILLISNEYTFKSLELLLKTKSLTILCSFLLSYFFFIYIKKIVAHKVSIFALNYLPLMHIKIDELPSGNIPHNEPSTVLSITERLSYLEAIMKGIAHTMYVVLPYTIFLYFIDNTNTILIVESLLLIVVSIVVIVLTFKINEESISLIDKLDLKINNKGKQ